MSLSLDEKEKFDPQGFRDSLLLGIKETSGDLEQLFKFLDASGSKLNYHRYGESLIDILIAGGLLEPGGTLLTNNDPENTTTDISVFGCDTDDESVKAFTQVFIRLTRRYKYLENVLDENLKKIVKFLRAFSTENRLKLGKFYAYLLSAGIVGVAGLKSLLEQDPLVKEGLAFEFFLVVLSNWQSEKDASTVWTTLRKALLDSKLLDFMPKPKRSQENFSQTMLDYGLGQLLDYQKAQRVETLKKELSSEIETQIIENVSAKELTEHIRDHMAENSLSEQEVIVILWTTLMGMVEWNKKEELVADQAVKYLRSHSPLFAEFTKTNKSELALLYRIQDFCYNMSFYKAFQKIVLMFYKSERFPNIHSVHSF